MNRTTATEFARQAWDFRDSAVGAEHLLGERIEYQLNASLPVALLFGTCIDLALRSFILAMDSSRTEYANPDRHHDLESLANEANRLGLARLVRLDSYEVELFSLLSQLRSKSTPEYAAVQAEEIPVFDSMKKLSEKLLEVAGAMAGYERETYE